MSVARTLLAEALGLPADRIDAATAIGATREWDSLAHMRLVLAVETHLGRVLGTEEIVSITALADVEALLDGPAQEGN